ncbi:MAG: type II toxin-antitoxin system HicA family toxin [Bryobacteraceae bacterium]
MYARDVGGRDVVRMIEANGWRFHSQRGSHRQYKARGEPGRVTIAGKPGEDMHPKTLASVLRQAEIEKPGE